MRRSVSLKNLLIYGLGGPIVALNCWVLYWIFGYFQNQIIILSTAAILAFLLNYIVEVLERIRFNRIQAIIVVLLFTLAVLVIIIVTLSPVVIDQTSQLLNNIPDWWMTSETHLRGLEMWAKKRRLPVNFGFISIQINESIRNLAEQFTKELAGIAGLLLSAFINFVLIIVLAFYMLLYGENFFNGLINLCPTKIRAPLAKSLKLNFHYFFLSQILLALFMVITLTPIFLILQVPFALIFAIIIGISQLIPFVGATLGIGLVSFIILLQSWWMALQVTVAAIIVQQIKDNLLTPKLLGNFIGLNPIWIIVALLLGFQIAGLFGTLVAIPIAGTIKSTFDALKST
ncbi:MAG: AI-2E family transporter [Cyanobacteria bacterium P01_A01_bin.45]